MTTRKLTLDALKVAPENPRKSRTDAALDTMAESLLALGQAHSLVGYWKNGDDAKAGPGMVKSGGTRLLAMRALREAGRIGKTHALASRVSVEIRDRDTAVEIGLAANEVVSAMAPAERFRAYQALAQAGASESDIAARYGHDVPGVRRILALAGLAPPVFKALEAGKL